MKRKTSLLLILFMLLGKYLAEAQSISTLDVPLLHQLVGNSKTEHAKQTDAKTSQAKATANEALNRSLAQQVTSKYRTLQSRYAKMTIIFDAANIGIEAMPLVKDIIRNQQRIIVCVQKDPALAFLALQTETDFIKRTNSLVDYLLGLCLSIGDVNQMKASDRRILFNFVIDELRSISFVSGGLARSLQETAFKTTGADPFLDYINQEERQVKDIIKKYKALRS